MDGGGELGKSRDIHQTFTNFGYTVELTGPDSSNQNGPGGNLVTKRKVMHSVQCCQAQTSNRVSGLIHLSLGTPL